MIPNSAVQSRKSILVKDINYGSNPATVISGGTICAKYTSQTTTLASDSAGQYSFSVAPRHYELQTRLEVPRTGVMIVGLGGNNGTTFMAALIANRKGLQWETKTGMQEANYYGSLFQSSTVQVGTTSLGKRVFVPFNSILPTVNPNHLLVSGWDICGDNLATAMDKAGVLEPALKKAIRDEMAQITPLPAPYFPDFIAMNQKDRANNTLKDSHSAILETLRKDIRDFKEKNRLQTVIVIWSGNTERWCQVKEGLNMTAEELLQSIQRNESEISPSVLFGVASVLEGCPYINGSPQNTMVPGLVELATRNEVLLAGDDLKTGQTKIKTMLVDGLISSGIKPLSIVSYNHLGNNDGMNLSAKPQFRSKEISKGTVIDDIVEANPCLYSPGEYPSHRIIIEYIPPVGDSKRALDEIESELMLGGRNTISLHNTCEDSLLAVPVIIDLVVGAELFTRIRVKELSGNGKFMSLNSLNSLLAFFLKAPVFPKKGHVVNSLSRQRMALENFLKACAGLPLTDEVFLEERM